MTPFEILTKDAMAELKDASDRAVAILGAVLIDNALRELIVAHLRTDKSVENELFQVTGPLGALGPKVRLAYMMSLIEKPGYKDILSVEFIRNRFAHKLDYNSFNHSEVVKRIGTFSTNSQSEHLFKVTDCDVTPRALFFQALYVIIDRVISYPKLEPTTGILREVNP